MKSTRMIAFVAAVLITASLFRVIADGFTLEQPLRIEMGEPSSRAAASVGPKTAAD
jgi:archaellum component FlaG (FlaF/FlaG flagellin family)